MNFGSGKRFDVDNLSVDWLCTGTCIHKNYKSCSFSVFRFKVTDDANFADRWPLWTGARLEEVHLHSKPFGGTLRWPLKGGSRLIEVTATAGLTVY